MAGLARVVRSIFSRRQSAPGKAVVVQVAAEAGEERQVELYHSPGIASAPTKGDRIITIPIGRSAFRIAIGTHNYRVEIDAGEGETIVYSTNASGSTVQASIKLGTDGNIEINGGSKRLVTYGELNTALQLMVTAINAGLAAKVDGGGTPGAVALDISAAQTTSVRTNG